MALSGSKNISRDSQKHTQLGNIFIPNPPQDGDAYLWDDLFFVLWDSGFKILIK